MSSTAVNLEGFYASLKGIIEPPLKAPADVDHDPLVLVAVKEVCYWGAKTFGWTFRGEIPDHIDKAVVILAPHTSMLDFFIGMAAYRHFKTLRGYYLAKKELFSGPFRFIFEKTGGIPVDRQSNNHLVDQVAVFFQDYERFFLALAPEGTRKHTKQWKSGFYRIAVKADVPVIMAYMDFKKKEAGVGEILYPSGDFEADAKKIEDFYKNVQPMWSDLWNWKVT